MGESTVAQSPTKKIRRDNQIFTLSFWVPKKMGTTTALIDTLKGRKSDKMLIIGQLRNAFWENQDNLPFYFQIYVNHKFIFSAYFTDFFILMLL